MSMTEDMVLSQVRRLTKRDLRLWVRQGWVRPALREDGPVFDDLDIARLRLLRDLRKDMGVPVDVLPVVLNLMDQLHQARRDVQLLLRILEDQPGGIREAVGQSLRLRGPGGQPNSDD